MYESSATTESHLPVRCRKRDVERRRTPDIGLSSIFDEFKRIAERRSPRARLISASLRRAASRLGNLSNGRILGRSSAILTRRR